jgi:hypothetical protein
MNYKKIFKEGFLRSDVEKAMRITCKILSKRLSRKIYISQLPEDVEKMGIGKITGISAFIDGGWQIRFNTKYNATSGDIESVDLWLTPRINPHFSIDTAGISIVKIIDVIVQTFLNPQTNVYKMEEDVAAMGGGIKSEALSKSINAWFKEMQIDETKLANTRIKHLYNQSYLYWYNSVRTEEYVLVSESSFRNYLIQAFEKNGIKNIFMRDILVSKGSKEKQIINKKNEDEFNKTTFSMTLADTVDYLKTNVRLVTRGYSNALVIGGTAGVGKSKLVLDTLKEEGAVYKYFSGGIKNNQAFFDVLSKNNKEGLICVFDDADYIVSKKAEDITKALLGTEPVRQVIWFDAKFKAGSTKNNPEIGFKSRVIIITNLPKRKLSPAIISRTTPIEIDVALPEIIDDIRINLNNLMPEYPDITYEMKKIVLDFIEKVIKHVDQIDYRIFFHCVKVFSSGTPNWKKFIMPVLKKEAI